MKTYFTIAALAIATSALELNTTDEFDSVPEENCVRIYEGKDF